MIQTDQSLMVMPLPAAPRPDIIPLIRSLKPQASWFRKIFASRMPIRPAALNHETFLEFVAGHRFAVIHFWAPWSQLDCLMSNLLASYLSDKSHPQIALTSFNIDLPAHLELARQHKVFDLPFLAFYREGRLARTTTGLHTPGVMTKYLRELVKSPTTGPATG